MDSNPLPLRFAALALLVVFVWGTNFVVIRLALDTLPPLLFGALRFTFAVFPAVFWLKRPPVSWRNLAAYGLLIGLGQFGLLYLAMRADISPGLASLVIQTQVFFTIGLSVFYAQQRVQRYQVLALVLGVAGIAIIAFHTEGSTTLRGLLMVLVGAFCWALGNLVSMRAGRVNMLAYVVWSSLFAALALLVLSLVVEGWPAIAQALARATLATWLEVLWQSIGNSLFGFAVWGWLLSRYPAATVTPMALLVPVFGMASSSLILGEPLPAWKLGAAALVIAGLALNVVWPIWRARWAR
jgi:O-acetylserine/cysteine efflux transporter